MEVSEAKRLRPLENENHGLKTLLAESMMDVSTLRDARKKLLKPGARRSAASCSMTEKGYSRRRACRLLGIVPRAHRYRTSRQDNAVMSSRLRELSDERRQFGYRRLHTLLEREG